MFTTGFITYNTGFWNLGPWGRNMDPQLKFADQSSMLVGMTNATNDGTGWTCQLQTGHVENGIAADWTTRVMGLRLKLGGQLDVSGELTAFADAMGRVTEYTRAGATFQLGSTGVQLKLYLSRLGQKITLPILLSADLNPYVVLGTAVLPAVSWAAAYHFWVLPKKERDIKKWVIMRLDVTNSQPHQGASRGACGVHRAEEARGGERRAADGQERFLARGQGEGAWRACRALGAVRPGDRVLAQGSQRRRGRHRRDDPAAGARAELQALHPRRAEQVQPDGLLGESLSSRGHAAPHARCCATRGKRCPGRFTVPQAHRSITGRIS